ncbi:MAG: hypothetical protein C0468_03545 [Planctomyces sp.]|nr:hypothetical protein [Planctomyces sp.]
MWCVAGLRVLGCGGWWVGVSHDGGAVPTTRVLIIDDDPGVLEVACEALMRHGHACAPTRTGSGALSLLARERFSVIVLDLALPDTDGLSLCYRLMGRAAGGAGASLPVVLISGDPWRVSEQELAGTNVRGVLAKPLDPARLCAAVDLALRLRIGPEDDHWSVLDRAA